MAHRDIPDPDHMDSGSAADEPAEVKQLRPVLIQATEALYKALQRYEMWRVLAQDAALHSRLKQRSMAREGFFQLRGMVFDALVVALTRMFDWPMKDRNPLSLLSLGKAVTSTKVQAYIADRRAQDRLTFPARLSACSPLSAEHRMIYEQHAEAEAAQARIEVAQEFEDLEKAINAVKFKNKPAFKALKRLKDRRNKVIAHRDLDIEPTDLPGTYGDLKIVFEAASQIISRSNQLIRNVSPNNSFDIYARLRAKCLVAGLRAETFDERSEAQLYAKDHDHKAEGSL